MVWCQVSLWVFPTVPFVTYVKSVYIIHYTLCHHHGPSLNHHVILPWPSLNHYYITMVLNHHFILPWPSLNQHYITMVLNHHVILPWPSLNQHYITMGRVKIAILLPWASLNYLYDNGLGLNQHYITMERSCIAIGNGVPWYIIVSSWFTIVYHGY